MSHLSRRSRIAENCVKIVNFGGNYEYSNEECPTKIFDTRRKSEVDHQSYTFQKTVIIKMLSREIAENLP